MCFAAFVTLSIVTLAARSNPPPLIDMMPAWTHDVFRVGALRAAEGPTD